MFSSALIELLLSKLHLLRWLVFVSVFVSFVSLLVLTPCLDFRRLNTHVNKQRIEFNSNIVSCQLNPKINIVFLYISG